MKKTALVLSGGGADCVIQAGMLQTLQKKHRYLEGFFYIAGTSGGSLNALGLAQAPPKEWPQALAKTITLWLSIRKRKDILGSLWSVFGARKRGALFSNKNLRALLRKHVDLEAIRKSGIFLRLPSVDLPSGKLVVGSEEWGEDLLDAALASSAFPGVLPPVRRKGLLLTDGGIRDNTPVKHAINSGADEILVLLASPSTPSLMVPEDFRWPWAAPLRSIAIMMHEQLMDDLNGALDWNRKLDADGLDLCPHTGKRRIPITVHAPTRHTSGTFDFNPESTLKRLELGRNSVSKISGHK